MISKVLKTLCDDAVRLAEKGKLPPEMKLLAQMVEQWGHEDLFRVVEEAMGAPDKFTKEKLATLLAEPPRAEAAGIKRFFARTILPREVVEYAKYTPLSDLSHIEQIEADVLNRMAKPGDGSEMHGWKTITSYLRMVDPVLEILGRRIGAKLLSDKKIGTVVTWFSELPASMEFADTVAAHLQLPPETVYSWRGSLLWKEVAKEFFAGILPYNYGKDADTGHKSLQWIAWPIEHKAKWWDELREMGVSVAEIEGSITWTKYRSRHARDDELVAIAELRRIVGDGISEARMKRWSSWEERRIAVLIGCIGDLHVTHPDLGEEEILELLPPLWGSMTAEEILDGFRRGGRRKHYFGANMIYWHMKPSDAVINRFVKVLGAGWCSDTFAYWCDTHFIIGAEQFWQKVRQLASAGMNVAPIISAFEEKFPDDVDKFKPLYPESGKGGMKVMGGEPKPRRTTSGGGASSSDCSITNVPLAPRPMGFKPGIVATSGMMTIGASFAI